MRLLHPRFKILTLMVVVAISAIVMSWFRPISPAEAQKIAEARFLKIPGASRWIGRYGVHAGPVWASDQPKRYADGWTIVVSDSRDGFPLARYFLTPQGKLRAADFAPGRFYDLFDVIREDDADRVKELLDGGVDANTPNENGYTPIDLARDPKIIDLLIAHGAKLNMRTKGCLRPPSKPIGSAIADPTEVFGRKR
jgi:ankyrin repeat protein